MEARSWARKKKKKPDPQSQNGMEMSQWYFIFFKECLGLYGQLVKLLDFVIDFLVVWTLYVKFYFYRELLWTHPKLQLTQHLFVLIILIIHNTLNCNWDICVFFRAFFSTWRLKFCLFISKKKKICLFRPWSNCLWFLNGPNERRFRSKPSWYAYSLSWNCLNSSSFVITKDGSICITSLHQLMKWTYPLNII